MNMMNLFSKSLKGYIMIFFIISGVLSLSSCVSQKINGIRELASKTEFQKLPAGVKEVWQLPLKDEEISQIIPVSETRALVHTIKYEHYLSGTVYFYKYSNLLLVNIESGQTLWTFSTLDLGQKRQKVIAVSPSILILSTSNDTTSFVAVNPESGQKSWKLKVESNSSYYLSPDNRDLFVSFAEKGIWTVEKLSAIDGKSKWKSVLTGTDIKNAVSSYFIPGYDLRLVTGNKIFSLNSDNGSVKWQLNTLKSISSCFNSGDQLWIYNNHAVVAVDNLTGKTSAEFSIADKNIIGAVVYDRSLLTSVYDSTKQITGIECFDIASHNLVWEFTVKDGLKSSLYRDNDYLYFTGRNAFYNIDMSSGKLKTMISLPDSIESKYVAFDDIWKVNDRYLINRENSMLIVSRSDNSVLSDCYFGIAGGFTSSYLQQKINEIRRIRTGGETHNVNATYNLYSDNSFYNMAKQNQAYVYSRTAPIVASNSTANFSEKMSAYNQRELASQNTYNQGLMQAQQQYMQAGAQFGASVGAAIGTLIFSKIIQKVHEANSHNMNYLEEKMGSCFLYRNNPVLNNFYIRPYFDQGWRLAIIDVTKPGYARIPMTPDLLPLHYSVTQSIVYHIMVKGDKKILLAKSYKPSPEGQDTYKFRYPNHYNSKMDEWEMPKPSLVCYDISLIETEPKDPWSLKSPGLALPLDKQLVEGVFYLNVKKVKELIKQGANVNATDEFGHTALMHVCQIGDFKTFKLLMKAGANPRLEDPDGLNAVDYLGLPAYEKSMDIKQLAKMQRSLKRAYKKFK